MWMYKMLRSLNAWLFCIIYAGISNGNNNSNKHNITMATSASGSVSAKHIFDHIQSRVSQLSGSLPRHLAIILEHEASNNMALLHKLADVLMWSVMAGISRITIMERTGELKKQLDILQHTLEGQHKRLTVDNDNNNDNNITFSFNWLNKSSNDHHSHDADHGHATVAPITNQRVLDISVVSADDGKLELVNITKKYTKERKLDESLELNEHYIQSNLPRHIGGEGSEPEIAMDFTERNILSGFLPWHVKLTEFIKVDNFNQMYLEKYLHVLQTYGRIEKRCGK
ncbi:hypothetical protein SAMD00019534_086700 [Acytostelium subglobosum LB1]|uniref:hypothetical protein n=1 Tax=Acytostelium subglobosum LB1 TaxID=1410327 RepID=UPI000644DF4A|nr:hypothetical protein SAMD00019534_086700 [Acytostelium subglobosum LB1]GAM25495.1 hypothetical protein SAMD00019534_086700 [Acytostelium subglobosum LB1]|eukprot:XP_012751481.1 hypothetical protein SAMD00019534_086700 [Acytostelium subglobosum LB1]